MKTQHSLHSLFLCGLLATLPLATSANPPDFPPCGPEVPPLPMGKHGAFAPDRLPPYLSGLNLSEAQQAKIKEILKTQGSEIREKAEAGDKSHEELRQLAFSPDFSEEKAKSFAQAAAPLMMDMAVLHARLDHAVFEVLNPEQQRQAKENMAHFKAAFPKP